MQIVCKQFSWTLVELWIVLGEELGKFWDWFCSEWPGGSHVAVPVQYIANYLYFHQHSLGGAVLHSTKWLTLVLLFVQSLCYVWWIFNTSVVPTRPEERDGDGAREREGKGDPVPDWESEKVATLVVHSVCVCMSTHVLVGCWTLSVIRGCFLSDTCLCVSLNTNSL